jgi:hypothetical protein
MVYRVSYRVFAACLQIKLFYSHWNAGQCEWAARDWTGDGTMVRVQISVHCFYNYIWC